MCSGYRNQRNNLLVECEVAGFGIRVTILGQTASNINGLNVSIEDKYTLFDVLAYNTCGYFASCVVFSEPRRGEEKYEQ